jgi:hypothetical protein
MTITRRGLIKNIVFASLLPTSAISAGSISCTATGHINIFIHGLFFLEVSRDGKNNLVINAPVSKHVLKGGTRSDPIVIGTTPINWSTVLEGGSFPGLDRGFPKDLPTNILRFSRTDTGVGDMTGTPLAQIILPWPKEFLSIRRGYLKDFVPAASTKHTAHKAVGDNILTLYSQFPDLHNRLGVVNGFRYCFNLPFPPLPGWTPTINFHFYLDPLHENTIPAVNLALIDAKTLFANGNSEFDLQLDESIGNTTTVLEAEGNLPPEVRSEDELAFDELIVAPTPGPLAGAAGPSVPLMQKSTAKSGSGGAQKMQDHAIVASTNSQGTGAQANINPANCPTFFVGE